MNANNLNQPQSGVFFNDQENQATFTLEICGKEDYFETIGHLLDLLGSAEDESCDRNKRYYVCRLISSMLPNKNQVHNIGDMPDKKLLALKDGQIKSCVSVIEEQRKKIEELQKKK